MPASRQEIWENGKKIARRVGPPIIFIGGGAVIGGGIPAVTGGTAIEIFVGGLSGGTIGGFPVGLKAEADRMGVKREHVVTPIKDGIKKLQIIFKNLH